MSAWRRREVVALLAHRISQPLSLRPPPTTWAIPPREHALGSEDGHRTSWTGSRGPMWPLVAGFLFLRSFDECQRQQAITAQRCFDTPHMQEPNIPPLFQTMPKAESPFSFLDTRHPPGTGSDTLSEKPHISPCRTLQSSDRVWRTEKRPKHRGVSVTPGPHPDITVCRHVTTTPYCPKTSRLTCPRFRVC